MAEKQVTIMKLKVDLECDKCYMKVKKVLCKFPQIRDQIYDEKSNTVIIKVVCCSPEKLRDKLCCQGGGSIKSIEIVELPKLKPPEPEKPKPPEPPKPKPPPPEKPKSPPPPAPLPEPPRQDDAATPPPPTPAVKFPEPVPVSVLAHPSPAASVGLFYQGGLGGPTGFHGRPIYDGYGGGGPCYEDCHCRHLCEEDASVCRIT